MGSQRIGQNGRKLINVIKETNLGMGLRIENGCFSKVE